MPPQVVVLGAGVGGIVADLLAALVDPRLRHG